MSFHVLSIYIQRSLPDVVSSYMRMGRYGSIRDSVERWYSANLNCIRFRDKISLGNITTVRYEDVVTNPEGEFSKIFDFLDLELKMEFLNITAKSLPMGDHGAIHYNNIHQKIFQSGITKGRKSLSDTQLNEIEDIIFSLKVPSELYDLL